MTAERYSLMKCADKCEKNRFMRSESKARLKSTSIRELYRIYCIGCSFSFVETFFILEFHKG
jgi:hypothetical protein